MRSNFFITSFFLSLVELNRLLIDLISVQFNEVQRWQRPYRKLLQPSATCQSANVNCGETDLAENAVHLRLGGGIVSRHEQHTMSTGFVRIGSQNRTEQSVAGFYEASAGSQRCHNLARRAAIQIGDLKVRFDNGVSGIHQDATIPWRQIRERGTHMHPRHGQYDDVSLRRFLSRAGFGARTEFTYQCSQRVRTTAVANNGFEAGFCNVTCQGLADAASANDSNIHNDSFQHLLLMDNCYAALTFFSACGVARSCCSHMKVVPTTPACSTRTSATAAAVSVLAQSLCSSAAKTIQVIGMAPA